MSLDALTWKSWGVGTYLLRMVAPMVHTRVPLALEVRGTGVPLG